MRTLVVLSDHDTGDGSIRNRYQRPSYEPRPAVHLLAAAANAKRGSGTCQRSSVQR